jgi:hypothetical protein
MKLPGSDTPIWITVSSGTVVVTDKGSGGYSVVVNGDVPKLGTIAVAIAQMVGAQHQWITTSAGQAIGMNPGGHMPGEGGVKDCWGVKTYATDHTGRVPETQRKVRGVDKAALDTHLVPGTYLGRYMPWNNCNTWVAGALANSTPHDVPFLRSGPRPPGVGYWPPYLIRSGALHNKVQYSNGTIHDPGGVLSQ